MSKQSIITAINKRSNSNQRYNKGCKYNSKKYLKLIKIIRRKTMLYI